MGMLFAMIAFNYTEAAFRGLHPIWTMFFLISIDYVGRTSAREARMCGATRGVGTMGSDRTEQSQVETDRAPPPVASPIRVNALEYPR